MNKNNKFYSWQKNKNKGRKRIISPKSLRPNLFSFETFIILIHRLWATNKIGHQIMSVQELPSQKILSKYK